MVVKIKVVHISTHLAGGAGRAAYRIHEALLRKGVESSFLFIGLGDQQSSKNIFLEPERTDTIIKSPDFLERQKNRIRFRIKKHLGIEIKSLKDKERDGRKKVIEQLENIRATLSCEIATLPFSKYNFLENPIVKHADIIHLHWVAGMLDYPVFFQKNKKGVVWSFHDMNPFQGLFHYKEDELRNQQITKSFDKAIRNLKQKALEKRQSELVVITPSFWLLEETNNSATFRKVKSSCIPYPINTNVFYPEKNFDFKRRYNIPEKNCLFLFVANSTKVERKGFQLLLEALQKMKNKLFTLIVLGDSNNIQIEGLDVRFAGVVRNNDSLRRYYSSANAFIIPSREDNLPNVMLESLACGTPVIGFPVGGIKEHIFDFKTGLLADDLSSESLARAIDKFFENKELFSSEEIHNYVKDNFNEDDVANEYIKVYNELLKKNKVRNE